MAGYYLDINGLCDASIKGMSECRNVTGETPATALFVRVWKYTPKGSSIRKLLLAWGTEYMDTSESHAEFARNLPQEILSELAM